MPIGLGAGLLAYEREIISVEALRRSLSRQILGGGLVGGLRYGGRACLEYLVLRVLIWRNGDAPWNYAAFLDYAADRILLRKVGGYIFIHRMLMEYFATLPNGTAPVSMSGRSGGDDTEPHGQ